VLVGTFSQIWRYKIFYHPSNFLATDYKPNIKILDGFKLLFFLSLSLFHFLAIENPQKNNLSFQFQFLAEFRQ